MGGSRGGGLSVWNVVRCLGVLKAVCFSLLEKMGPNTWGCHYNYPQLFPGLSFSRNPKSSQTITLPFSVRNGWIPMTVHVYAIMLLLEFSFPLCSPQRQSELFPFEPSTPLRHMDLTDFSLHWKNRTLLEIFSAFLIFSAMIFTSVFWSSVYLPLTERDSFWV